MLDDAKKSKDLEVYDSDSDFKSSYNQLLKSFREMHTNTLCSFKKISHQIKLISKLKKEICELNIVLESLKKLHASLVNKQFIAYDYLGEKVVEIEYDTCLTLKIKNKNLKGQLAQVIYLPTIVSTFSSERENT